MEGGDEVVKGGEVLRGEGSGMAWLSVTPGCRPASGNWSWTGRPVPRTLTASHESVLTGLWRDSIRGGGGQAYRQVGAQTSSGWIDIFC